MMMMMMAILSAIFSFGISAHNHNGHLRHIITRNESVVSLVFIFKMSFLFFLTHYLRTRRKFD